MASGGSSSFGSFDPSEIGAFGAAEEDVDVAEEDQQPASAAGAGYGEAAEPQEPAADEEQKVPFPQLSTVRRPPSRDPAQRPWVRSSLGKVSGESRLSVVFWGLILTVMVAYGALVGLGRDPLGIWEVVGLGRVGEPIQLRSSDLSTGLYPQADGGSLLFLKGMVHRIQPGDAGAIRVEATLRDEDGSIVATSAGWAGISPGPEELAAVETEADWIRLSGELGARIPAQKVEGQLPFVLAFPGVDPGTRRLAVEVEAKSLPVTAPTVEEGGAPDAAEGAPALSDAEG